MFDRDELTEAVAIQRASFALLRWLRGAIEKGLIKLDTAHDYMEEARATAKWIARHYANLPPASRPAADSGPALERFANYFASYLTTSFQLDVDPPVQVVSVCGCWCPICRTLGKGPYLKARDVRRDDKKKAERLKRNVLQALAASAGVGLTRFCRRLV